MAVVVLTLHSVNSCRLNSVRMMMKMAAASTVTALLLFCSLFASADSQDQCDINVATNGNITVPLNHQLKPSERLIWTQGNTVILTRRENTKNPTNLYENGSLKLTNVKKSDGGLYKPGVFIGGQAIQKELKSILLCIIDPVPKPKVRIECPKTGNKIQFICEVGKIAPKDVSIEWHRNGKVVDKQKDKSLTFKADDVMTDTFSCKVTNRVSSMTSESLKQPCISTGFVFPEEVFGINTWILVAIGGGVVMVLILIIIFCCVRNSRKKRLQLKDEEELRLGWTNPNQQQHHHHHHHQHSHLPEQQHPHHQHHHQQQPAGHTGPRQHRTKQPRNQQRPKAPDVPNDQPQPSPRRPAQIHFSPPYFSLAVSV
uniref:Ig-like domain-containing protein n=1 Tax=Dicentrarchus labrax TaxID=13489 RepID=A0A8C4IV80_DICLA